MNDEYGYCDMSKVKSMVLTVFVFSISFGVIIGYAWKTFERNMDLENYNLIIQSCNSAIMGDAFEKEIK